MLRWIARKALGKLAMRHARKQSLEFELATHHPQEVQEALRDRLIQRHAHTQFARDHRFDEIHTLEDFRRNLPISQYEDYESYIAKVRAGKLDALVGEPFVHMFAMTSGTTAGRKFIPVTQQYLDDYRRGWHIWGVRAFEKHPNAKFGAMLQLVGDWDEFRTEGGIPCGSVSGLTASMQKRVVRWLYCVPPQAAQIENTIAKYYVALRLGLTRRVRMITSANPSTLVNLARLGNEEKESLIRDIFDGSLTDRYPVPDFVRQALGRKIRRPNPRCAEKLEAIVNQTGTLYPKDYWPELALLGNWTAGSVGAYLRHYPKYFGDATIRDLGLLASEGRMTIVVDDNTPSGVLDVGTHFYEFIPEEEIDSPQPTVLLAHELEAGKSYYILLTTSYGFCRYNIFDLVRVTGWYNKTPLLEFLNKGAHFSSITGEKLSEFQVSRAMIATLEELDTTLTGYALAPCWDDEQPYYGLFLERGDLGGIRNAGRITEIMDRHLRRLNIEYDGKRASQRLGMIRAELLPTGEWTRWNARRLQQTGGTAEQYKQPCLISDHTFREQMPVEEELEPESELVAV